MAAPDRQLAAAAIDSFLRALGIDGPDTDGTGARVAQMFADDLCSGYAVDTRKLATEAAISVGKGGIVVVRDIDVATTCPHHLVPSIGKATVAFKAKGHVIGLGTIASLVDAHARRLMLQENIGENVVDDLFAVLSPEWAVCRLVLAHSCMIVRGERAHGTTVETIAVRGEADLSHIVGVLR